MWVKYGVRVVLTHDASWHVANSSDVGRLLLLCRNYISSVHGHLDGE
jgi:hypothetical protein